MSEWNSERPEYSGFSPAGELDRVAAVTDNLLRLRGRRREFARVAVLLAIVSPVLLVAGLVLLGSH